MGQRAPLAGVLGGLVLLAAVSFALASRGGPRPVRIDAHLARITLSEYSITPQSISVPAGSVEIVVHNSGILTHNLTLEHEHLDSNGEQVVIASTHTVMPGATVSIATGALSPGRYHMTSTISNQADLGMSGTLIVR